jgi:hypothetical protein
MTYLDCADSYRRAEEEKGKEEVEENKQLEEAVEEEEEEEEERKEGKEDEDEEDEEDEKETEESREEEEQWEEGRRRRRRSRWRRSRRRRCDVSGAPALNTPPARQSPVGSPALAHAAAARAPRWTGCPSGRDLHSYTSQLNLSRFWSLKARPASTSQLNLRRFWSLKAHPRLLLSST